MSIRHRLASIVNRELEKMERGEIDELSSQHNDMLHQLLQSPRSIFSNSRFTIEARRCRMDMMGVVVSRVDAGSVLPSFVSSTPAERDDSFSPADVSRCCGDDISDYEAVCG